MIIRKEKVFIFESLQLQLREEFCYSKNNPDEENILHFEKRMFKAFGIKITGLPSTFVQKCIYLQKKIIIKNIYIYIYIHTYIHT
jgi:hypothetical protein